MRKRRTTGLTQKQRLQLQQLRLLEWVEQQAAFRQRERTTTGAATSGPPVSTASAGWDLLGDLHLRPWQQEAARQWFAADGRGTIKVVTGAGKTVLALGIAEQLQHEDPDLRMAVVVPTVVLLQQWYETLRTRSNLRPEEIGRLGGGFDDDFEAPRKVLIAVLASARKSLPAMVRGAGIGDHLMLVVDESHRAGAPQMSAVLKTPRAYTLGLSATPERDATGDEETDEVLERELGGIVFEMSFADAIRQGVLPPFELQHFGLPLNAEEARRYETLTRSINDARRELTAFSPGARKAGSGEGLLAWARRAASQGSGQVGAVARRYVNDTRRRKQLLYQAEARTAAVIALVREALEERSDARIILFHESIAEVVRLYEEMLALRVPVVMEHSRLPPDLREASLDLFRSGAAQVVVSARSLVEGFNVPEADVGIIVASSSSPRQRIQSIGRVLRKHQDAGGAEKAARVCVLYVRDTVDESIYERQDWEQLIGVERNSYFHWAPPTPPIEQAEPPRAAIPDESEVDFAALRPGDRYLGRYSGDEFSTDRHGNVIGPNGEFALDPQGVPAMVERLRGSPGRFRVTPQNRAILVRLPVNAALSSEEQLALTKRPGTQLPLRPEEEEWVTLFAGVLPEPLMFETHTDAALGPQGEPVDVSALRPGDPYPGPSSPAAELRFRQRGGGVIARRIPGGEAFATGVGADQLVERLREVGRSTPVNRFWVNESGHVFWRERGQARFIAALSAPLDFPRDADQDSKA